MTPDLLYLHGIVPALGILPPEMDTHDARVLLLAIAQQESRLAARWQDGGPARGFWQCETASIAVANQSATDHVAAVMRALDYDGLTQDPMIAYYITYDIILAAAMARLILWCDAAPLPDQHDATGGWACYLRNWRPGKPAPKRWADAHAMAVRVVEGNP